MQNIGHGVWVLRRRCHLREAGPPEDDGLFRGARGLRLASHGFLNGGVDDLPRQFRNRFLRGNTLRQRW